VRSYLKKKKTKQKLPQKWAGGVAQGVDPDSSTTKKKNLREFTTIFALKNC
jgi:hypothetical protein